MKKNDLVSIPQINDTLIYVGVVTNDTHFGEVTVLIGDRREMFSINTLEKLGTMKIKKDSECVAPATMALFEHGGVTMSGIIIQSRVEEDSSELMYEIMTNDASLFISGHQIIKCCQICDPIELGHMYDTDAII